MKTAFAWVVVVGVLAVGAGGAFASAESEIQAATSAGKVVFLVVTQGGVPGGERALQIAREAQGRVPGSAVIVLDRGATENQGLVRQYRLSGAPVPLVLVMAPNGVLAGGALLKDATADVLVSLVPTPKKAEVLKFLAKGAPVIVVASRKTMQLQQATFGACQQAWRMLEEKLATVFIDMDDKAERAYLKELNVNPKERVPTVVVFNRKAQKTAVFRQAVTAKALVDAVLKKMPCCPGGNC